MDREIELVTKFMETQSSIDGICGFWVDDEKIDGEIAVYIIIDSESITTNIDFVIKRFKYGIKSEIKKYLGLDVYVGSMAKKC